MLTFLNSAILLGLAAIAVPILIHLFTRQKTRIINFSSLRFLKELQKRQIRRLKLRQILLLILRTLFILALVLAFARPAVKQTSSASLQSGAQLTAVIILDNTLSMGREVEGQRLLDQAKKRALSVIDLMRPGDELYLLYPQDPPVFAHEGPRYNLESVRELIEATELSYSRTDFSAALSLADRIMQASTNINKEIYLISDLQKNGFTLTGNGSAAKWFDDNVKFFVLPHTKPAKNLAISSIEFANQILEKDKVVEVRAEVRNQSDGNIENKLVHLFVEGKRVAQDAVSPGAHASETVVFRMVPDRTGMQSGYVLLEDDDLLGDNRRYFSFHIPDEISVLLVGNQKSDTYFLSLALQPEKKSASRFKVREIQSGGFEQEELDQYDAIILSNVPRFDYVETNKLKSFVEAGGGLFVFLGADVNLRNYNENLHEKLGLPSLTEAISSGSREEFLSLGKIDYSHSIFQGVFEENQDVASPHFRFAVNVSSDKPYDKIMEFSNAAPFLFESKSKKGRILYVTTGISNDWSDLVLRGIFVPLVNRSVAYLAGSASEVDEEILVGHEIAYYPEARLASADLIIETPDGSRIKVRPEVAQGQYYIRFNGANQPGIYRLHNENELVAQWSVNYDAAETEQAALPIDELKKTLGDASVYEIRENDEIAQKLQESRFGRELWKYFVLAALIFLSLEMLLYRERKATVA